MRTPLEILNTLSFEQKARIILDYESMKNETNSEALELRRVVGIFHKEYELENSSMWIDLVANTVAHELAKEYIKLGSIRKYCDIEICKEGARCYTSSRMEAFKEVLRELDEQKEGTEKSTTYGGYVRHPIESKTD